MAFYQNLAAKTPAFRHGAFFHSTKAWAVMNELMDDLMIGNKRVYDRVMDKLRRV